MRTSLLTSIVLSQDEGAQARKALSSSVLEEAELVHGQENSPPCSGSCAKRLTDTHFLGGLVTSDKVFLPILYFLKTATNYLGRLTSFVY
jgi:hypothetical protein